MTTDISNMDDVIDSRDVIARIAELEEERDELQEALQEATEAMGAFDPEEGGGDEAELQQNVFHAEGALKDWTDSNGAELAALKELAEQASGYADDWSYGETLIRDSYFKDYAMELADDIGAINSEAPWPNNCIDWDRAARELQMDYTAVEFGGVTYWVR